MTFAPMKCPTPKCGANRWTLRRETNPESRVVGLRATCWRCGSEFRIGVAPKEIPWPTSPASVSAN